MRERKIHPSVFIEIKGDNTGAGRGERRLPGIDRTKRSFTIVEKRGCGSTPTGEDEIDGAIVVEVRGQCGNAGSVAFETGLLGPIRKRSVAVVPPQNVRRRRLSRGKAERAAGAQCEIREARDVEIEIAVVVIID